MKSKKMFARKAIAAVAALALTLSSTGLMNASKPEITQEVVNAASTDNYAKLLQQSLFFYDANMCGKDVESKSLLTWRGNCHTSDEVPGGLHDAGDHAVFGLPLGYSASTLGWAYYEFKNSFDSLGLTGHLKTITNYCADFFRASTKLDGSGNVTSLLYQKGDGAVDHAYWGSPEAQKDTRKMYWTSNGSADIAAEYAAALAVNYINFGNTEDLKYAKALYKYSTTHNTCTTHADGGQTFYKSSKCTDEQAWAAGWLYLATKEGSYLNDLKSKQNPYIGWVHGWNDADLGAACLLGYATGDWSKANGYIGTKATGSNYMFLDKWGSARINASMQFTALVASKHSNADYTSWAKGQMNYLLGENPSRTCYVVGYADNCAKNPHHRAASGWNSYDQMGSNKTVNPNGSHLLVGALVGGPEEANGTYHDDISDYICNEVACDYNAGLVGAAAGLYDKYKTGSIESSIPGAKSNGVGNPIAPPSNTTTTPPSNPSTPAPTQTTKPSDPGTSSGDGYVLKLGQAVDYDKLPEDDKMIGWKWSEFGIPTSEKITKVDINISSSKSIGKWQGAFGSSTSVAADSYWTQTKDMSKTISGNSGTITWEIDSATSKIIQTQYGGELKFGIWWIDCKQFTIDSITVYTDGKGSSSVTTTAKPVTTHKAHTTHKATSAPIANVKGDVDGNGVVTSTDLVSMMQAIVGKKTLSSQNKTNADLNNDGKVSIIDLIMLKNSFLS